MGLTDLAIGGLSGPWLYVLIVPAVIFGILVSARRKIVQDLEVLRLVRELKVDPDQVFERQIVRSVYLSMKLAYGWPVFVPVALVGLSVPALLVLAAGLGRTASLGQWASFGILAAATIGYLAFMTLGLVLAKSKGIKDYEAFLSWNIAKQAKPKKSRPKARARDYA